jgi:hypothetical protein
MIDDNFYPPLPLNPGDVYTLLFDDGQFHVIEIVGDAGDGVNEIVIVDNGDIDLLMIEGTNHTLMPKFMIQDAAKRSRTEIVS